MICYDSGTFRLQLLRVRGAVLFVIAPQAFLVGLLGFIFKLVEEVDEGGADFFPKIVKSTEAYIALNALVFFLISHRTAASYARYVQGSELSQDFQKHVMSAGSLLFAYSHAAKCSEEVIENYHSTWVRLLSLLHAVGISKLHGHRSKPVPLEVIDMEGLDDETLKTFWAEPDNQVELVMNWMQASAVKSIGDNLLIIGPPIAAQVWVQLCAAYGAYMRALRLVEVPFPFPYVQLVEILIIIHCILTPIVFCGFSHEPVWNGIFCFLVAWMVLGLNKIASRVTDPYGFTKDSLDLDVMQEDINMRLLMLARPSTREVPKLSDIAKHVNSVMDADKVVAQGSIGPVHVDSPRGNAAPGAHGSPKAHGFVRGQNQKQRMPNLNPGQWCPIFHT